MSVSLIPICDLYVFHNPYRCHTTKALLLRHVFRKGGLFARIGAPTT